jgi:hypothetical protein
MLGDGPGGEGPIVQGRFLSRADADALRPVCLVPERMAKYFEIDLADTEMPPRVRLLGVELEVIGVFSEQRMDEVRDLDGENLVPVDYIATEERKQEQEKQRQAQRAAATGDAIEVEDVEEYHHLKAFEMIILPSYIADSMGASPRSICARAPDRKVARRLKENYVPRSMLVLFSGVGEQHRISSARGSLSMRGLASISIPFAIAALMVLNVMMGSVYERLKQIQIFSSVGLAPLHVGALFLAESCVYATLGAIFGYLLGQIVAKIVTSPFFSESGLLSGITLNYSSTSAVIATFLVGLVVIVSTLFPAKKAADYSVPDETRKLRLPAPEGDHWFIPFPFTVSSREALGLNAFLYDFLRSHDEATTGRFSASDVEMSSPAEGIYRLAAKVWLTPLDSGISQTAVFVTRPTADEPVISEIEISLDRLSGEVSSWRRLNLGYIVAMRKQFLIWRLVEAEDKADFARRGARLVGFEPEGGAEERGGAGEVVEAGPAEGPGV